MASDIPLNNSAGLPSPTPFVVLVVTLVVVLYGYFGYYILWKTLFGDNSHSGILSILGRYLNGESIKSPSFLDSLTYLITPDYVSILVMAIIVVGFVYYYPIVKAFSLWMWYTITGQRMSSVGTDEGFLVSPSTSPGVTEWVITRRELLDRLREHLFKLELPSGIKCGTSEDKNANPWDPSPLLIHEYLRRVASMYPINADPDNIPADAEGRAVTDMRMVCHERSIIQYIIQSMELDPTIQYSYKDAREHLKELIDFYNKSRIENKRIYSRRNVDNILGISLGQREPEHETELNIINSRRALLSKHDSGETELDTTPDKQLLDSSSSEHIHNVLPTQTNRIDELDSLAKEDIHHSRTSARMRGGNDSKPYAPYLTGLQFH